MKKIIACILLLAVLAGCVNVQETEQQTTPQASPDKTGETAQSGSTAQQQVQQQVQQYMLSAETKALVESQLTAGKNVVFPQNYKQLSNGQSYVFGIGVNNLQTVEDEFQVNVNFKKAYDKYMNTIETDQATMDSWVKTVFSPFMLDSYKSEIMGIAIEAGNMKPGVKAQAGTYVFEAQVMHRISPGAGFINSPYGSKYEISVRVQ